MASKPSPAPGIAPAAVAQSPFTVTFGDAPPVLARKIGAESSPYSVAMKGMPAPANGKIAQFFVPAPTNSNITDPDEQAKYKSAEARKITNRISGIARRLKKADASMVFAMRTREEDGKLGVRVYRVAPDVAKPAGT